MRRVLRGRHRALVAVLAWLIAASAGAQERASSIQITSPTGRSGLPGRVRIVARVTTVAETYPAVRFYVGDELLATDTDGPPYAVEWTDENPFEARRIRVEMTDGETVVEDHVDLKPFEVVEATEVLSINVDASIRDAKGRYVANLSAADFYRVRAFRNGIEIGLIDVDVVTNASGLASVDRTRYVGVERGGMLDIRFRIERPANGTVARINEIESDLGTPGDWLELVNAEPRMQPIV